MKILKKICLSIVMICLSLCCVSCTSDDKEYTYKIVATNFPCYDFARAVVKNNSKVSLTMLLKPGVESHNYDPTPQDIFEIQNADMFIYVGGESDEWANKILDSIESDKLKVVKLSDYVIMQVEEFKEGMIGEEEEEEEIEYDEHIWTSPRNAMILVEKIRDEIVKMDIDNKELYEKTSEEYINLLSSLDKEFREVVRNANRKTLVFGDRFPLIYFVKEYGLDYYAAFPGCSSESEVSAKQLVFLIDLIKNEDYKYIFHIELSSTKVCDILKEETGCEVLQFHTAHNVTKQELDSEETYYSLMYKNIEALKLATE